VESLWLQASPSGNGIGVRLVSDGHWSLTVVIYPKTWDRTAGFRRLVMDDASRHVILALAETEVVELVASEHILDLIRLAPAVHGDVAAVPLLSPTWPRQHTEPGSEVVDPRVALHAVLSLMHTSGSGDLRLAVEDVLTMCGAVPSLRPVLIDLFVQRLGACMRDFRRGYVSREEVTPYLRGRPQETDLALFVATGSGSVRCEFDEFMRATPLNIAIVSAIEVAARELSANPWWEDRLVSSRNVGVAIRRTLAEVPAVPTALARKFLDRAMGQVRGTRLEGVANLAKALLTDGADLESLTGNSAVEIRARPSTLWESLVELGFSSAVTRLVKTDSNHGVGFDAAGPWSGVGSETSRPDLFGWLGSHFFVLDAKYKLGGQAPVSADAYQAFAYSHLVVGTEENGVSHLPRTVGIVYPTSADSSSTAGPYYRTPDSGCELWMLWLPFPRLDDCEEGLSDYRRRLQREAQKSLSRMVFGHPLAAGDALTTKAQ